jgi:hypothetical protein
MERLRIEAEQAFLSTAGTVRGTRDAHGLTQEAAAAGGVQAGGELGGRTVKVPTASLNCHTRVLDSPGELLILVYRLEPIRHD